MINPLAFSFPPFLHKNIKKKRERDKNIKKLETKMRKIFGSTILSVRSRPQSVTGRVQTIVLPDREKEEEKKISTKD